MNTQTSITPDTTLFIPVHHSTDIVDFVLGNLSASDYARATSERGEEQNIQDICSTVELFVADRTMFLSRQYAEDDGDYGRNTEVKQTTPREIHRAIEVRAQEEKLYN